MTALAPPQTALSRALDNRTVLGLLFMLPAATLLLLFLTYPLGLGTYLGFTDTKIGRSGVWIGFENYEYLWGDAVTRLALFNTLFYTTVASIIICISCPSACSETAGITMSAVGRDTS